MGKNILFFILLVLLAKASNAQSYFKGLAKRMATPLALEFGAGFFNGVGETMLFHYDKSIFKKGGDFFNPSESWKFKYASWPEDKSERFPFSKTALVGFTDGFHASKTISLTFHQVVPIYYHRPKRKIHAVFDVILLKVAHGLAWELSNWALTY
jgi:hypothetical protein